MTKIIEVANQTTSNKSKRSGDDNHKTVILLRMSGECPQFARYSCS
jgi:hypothetical protein